jgi:integrase
MSRFIYYFSFSDILHIFDIQRNSMTKSIDKTSDYLSTEELRKLNRYFQNQKNYSMALLIEFGFRTLLRFSDLERFKWEDILNMDELTLNEKKTNKRRAIKVGEVLKELITKYYSEMENPYLKSKVFEYTLRHTNRLLQIGAKEIGIRKKNISTHSLRKSGARFIWEEFNKSDESLIKLSIVLNHSSSAITRRYLGITKEEIADIYEGFNFNL